MFSTVLTSVFAWAGMSEFKQKIKQISGLFRDLNKGPIDFNARSLPIPEQPKKNFERIQCQSSSSYKINFTFWFQSEKNALFTNIFVSFMNSFHPVKSCCYSKIPTVDRKTKIKIKILESLKFVHILAVLDFGIFACNDIVFGPFWFHLTV